MSKKPKWKIARDMPLNEWLAGMKQGRQESGFISWAFPSRAVLDEYLESLPSRSVDDVKALLENLLIPSGSLGSDETNFDYLIRLSETDPKRHSELLKYQYWKRLQQLYGEVVQPWEGITWILDLLPRYPRRALEALDAFHTAHASWLPDGRQGGLSDAEAVIRTKFIGNPRTTDESVTLLLSRSPRTLECLTERLYDAMGYATRLTPPQKDGGRDVIAEASTRGRKESLRIECKRHTGRTGVLTARALLGVVSDEKATKGVLVSTGGFTSGARALADKNPRLELLSGGDLVLLLNEHLGPTWAAHLEYYVRESERRNGETPTG